MGWRRALWAMMGGGEKELKMALALALCPPLRQSGLEACISGTARTRRLEEAGEKPRGRLLAAWYNHWC